MKKALLPFLLLIACTCNAQKYYPKLENMYLQAGDMDESVFYDEITFFRDGLRAAIKKVWMNGLQTSSGGNSAFYSLDLVPKWVYDVDFMQTGMILKFNHAKEDKVSYIPITCTETLERRDEKSGEGRIEFLQKGGVALEFPLEIMTPYNTEFKTAIPDAKCLFEPERATYGFDPATKSLSISLTGAFTTALKVGKTAIGKEDVTGISIKVRKAC
ncbi:hypothetical protein OGH69_06050 [Flavobacterium sp. MFBS3-15]|uniref:hypothetical protein n=1 Tax=Flavobacterium sp. MFBS3-15 TaxID=2989816 RepID=UPI002235685C|nr:hypothetical protein [Flavobacterium sp. MFBS3-15]MCW4468517.1 hypothetical protein [Flavobacterium sp. MFBS3-15]